MHRRHRLQNAQHPTMNVLANMKCAPTLSFVLRMGLFVVCCITLASAEATASNTSSGTPVSDPKEDAVSNGLFRDNTANHIANSPTPGSDDSKDSKATNVAAQVVVVLTEDKVNDTITADFTIEDASEFADDELPLPDSTPLVALAPASGVPDIFASKPYTESNQTNFLVAKVSSLLGQMFKNGSAPSSSNSTTQTQQPIVPTPSATHLHHTANTKVTLPALLSRPAPAPVDLHRTFPHKTHGAGGAIARKGADESRPKHIMNRLHRITNKSHRILPSARRTIPNPAATN